MYAVITLETAALDTPNKAVVLVADGPAKHAPTIRPLLKSDKSHFAELSYELLLTQYVLR